MKKIFKVFLLTFMLMCLFGCTTPEHDHSTSDKFLSDETYHWHPCIVENCKQKLNKEEHEMKNDICTICGYAKSCGQGFHAFGNSEVTYEDQLMIIKKVCQNCGKEETEKITVDLTVDNAVEWDQMFESFKLTNFSCDISLEKDEEGKWLTTNQCQFDSNGCYYNLQNEIIAYAEKVGENEWAYYELDEGEKYIKLAETSDKYYKEKLSEAALNISFKDNFEKFTYNEENGSYECSEVVEAMYKSSEGVYQDTLYCFNVVVIVVNGQISSIISDYYFGEYQDVFCHFEYYNIGTTIVNVPNSVKQNATPEVVE